MKSSVVRRTHAKASEPVVAKADADERPRSVSWWSELTHALFDEVPAHSIAVARAFWFLVMMWEIYSYTEFDYVKTHYQLVEPTFLFHYYGFDWIPRLDFQQWKLFLNVMLVLGGMASAGLFYHQAAFAFALGFAFLFLQCMSFYLNHFYLVAVLGFAYAFVPANRFWSLDALLGIAKPSPTVPFWTVAMTRILVSVVYVYAGYAKMNEDWIRGEPLAHWVPRRALLYPALAPILESYWNAVFMSWAGLLIDTFVPFLFLVPRLRWLGFLASFAFHVLNKIVFNIGIFPMVMTCVTTIFFRPDWPRVVWRVVTRQRHPLRADTESVRSDRRAPLRPLQRVVLLLLGSFLLWQTLLPLRHHFYAGAVEWNEEGHMFSWRMKLRDKAGMTKFYIKFTDTDGAQKTEIVDPNLVLTQTQVRKMNGRPQMILLFALHLANLVEEQLGSRPAVHVLSICSLNYRRPQLLIDPTVNLAEAEPWQWISDWIIDLVPRGVDEHPAFVKGERDVGGDDSKNRLYVAYNHLTIDDVIEQVSQARALMNKTKKK
jgi:vitamin K-dependent gamma-carboxylase